jgi:hypothetical protein
MPLAERIGSTRTFAAVGVSVHGAETFEKRAIDRRALSVARSATYNRPGCLNLLLKGDLAVGHLA